MLLARLNLALILSVSTCSVFAAPMPSYITVDDKAVVPILKTETIRRVTGEPPVRHVEATIFEVTNQGKDIIAREISLSDHQAAFSEAQLSIPIIKKGGVIIPTSKIELETTLKQEGQTFAKTKNIDAEGVEFKADGTVVKRHLQLGQVENQGRNERNTHLVLRENGDVTRDVVITEDTEQAQP